MTAYIKQINDIRHDIFKSYNTDDKKSFVEYHLKLIYEGDLGAINSLASYYLYGEQNHELAKKYYKLGVELNHINCIINLAYYYKDIEQNYEEMKKTFQIGIDQLNTICMKGMASYYKDRLMKNVYSQLQDYDEMVRYYKMAFDHGDNNGIYQLSLYYKYQTKDYDKMIECLMMGIDKGCDECMYSLGCYYDDIIHDYNQMKKYYLLSIEKGNPRAMFALGLHYDKKKHDYEQAIKYYLMGAEQDNDQCMIGLCAYYKSKGDIENMIKYYVKLVPHKYPEAFYEIARYCLLIMNDFDKATQYINSARELYYDEDEIKKIILLIKIKKNEEYNKIIIEEINFNGKIKKSKNETYLDFKYYIADKLKICNRVVIAKIAGSVNKKMKEMYLDLEPSELIKKNIEYFEENIDRIKEEFKDSISKSLIGYSSQTYYNMAMNFIKDNNLDDVYKCLKIAIDKGNIDALYALGRYYYLEGKHNSFMMKKCLKLAIKLADHHDSKLYLCNYYGYIEYNLNQHIRYLILSHDKNTMITYQDMSNNPYMYDPNNSNYNYIIHCSDNNITQINTSNGQVKLIEYDDEDDNYIKYTDK